MNFNHIILTRFNLQYELGNSIHLEPLWLEERFRLFEEYCLPSIMGQSDMHFTWIILASDQTASAYKTRLSKYSQTYSNIVIEYCPYTEDIVGLYKRIGEKYVRDCDYLLSTRIDSDDMLAPHFVQRLQSYIRSHLSAEAIITFSHGIQWFEKEAIAYAISYPQNHFLNFLEARDNIRTCLGIDHTKVEKNDMIQLEDKSMWCEIVHGTNICNGYFPNYHYYMDISTCHFPIHTSSKLVKRVVFLWHKCINFRCRQLCRHLTRLFAHRSV